MSGPFVILLWKDISEWPQDPEACVCARGWDWGGVQLLWLLDTWKLIAVEEHVLPLAFIWFLAMTLRKRGSII